MTMEMIEQMDFVFNGVAISFQPESLVYTDADNPSLRTPGSFDSETHIVGYSVMEILEKCADHMGKTTNGVST